MYINFKPKLSEHYNKEKLLVHNVLINKIGENISNIIFNFLRRPESGYKLFKKTIYIINNRIYNYNIDGHSLECVIRIMTEFNFLVKHDMLTSYGININDILNLYDEVNIDDAITDINLVNFLTQIQKIHLINKLIMQPSEFGNLFSKFCIFILNINNSKTLITDTKCKSCNFHKIVHNYQNISQIIFHPDTLFSENISSSSIKLCNNCKNYCIIDKIVTKEYCLKYWLLSTMIISQNKIYENIMLNNSKIFEPKAMIIYYDILPNGKYEVMIKRHNNWYCYSKYYIKKMRFDELIKIKPHIKYVLYGLINI